MDLEEDWNDIRTGARSEDETYVGVRDTFGQTAVYVEIYGTRRNLPVNELGYDWGYDGTKTTQLAIAILTDAYGVGVACKLYALFTEMVILKLPEAEWRLKRGEIDETLEMFL
jgi:hypothetical protein